MLYGYETEAPKNTGEDFLASSERQYQMAGIEFLFNSLGAELNEREGSRIEVFIDVCKKRNIEPKKEYYGLSIP